MTTHPNHVPSHSLSAAEQEQMFQRNVERLVQERDQRLREAEWPLLVNQLLHALAGKMQALEAEVATLRAGRG